MKLIEINWIILYILVLTVIFSIAVVYLAYCPFIDNRKRIKQLANKIIIIMVIIEMILFVFALTSLHI